MGKLISDKFAAWQEECEQRFQQLKANEEELNRIFIDIYGLQDELTPEVEDKDVTVRRADLTREIKSLLSYAVGCLFGRYSLDVDGLVYAGGEWDDSKYVTLKPVTDNVLPLCDEEYFGENDLVNRIVEFVRVVYGADTLEENLAFIAKALGISLRITAKSTRSGPSTGCLTAARRTASRRWFTSTAGMPTPQAVSITTTSARCCAPTHSRSCRKTM